MKPRMRQTALLLGAAFVTLVLIACVISYHEYRSFDVRIGEPDETEEKTTIIGNVP